MSSTLKLFFVPEHGGYPGFTHEVEHRDFFVRDGQQVPNLEKLDFDKICEEAFVFRDRDGNWHEDLVHVEADGDEERIVRDRRWKRAGEELDDEPSTRRARVPRASLESGPQFPTDYAKGILFSLLDNIADLSFNHLTRFQEWMQKVGNRNKPLFVLRPEVYSLFGPQVDEHAWADQLQAIGGDTSSQMPGIYMHIICRDGQIRLYIGQAVNLSKRITEHQNIKQRKLHPSLHYSALDGAEWDQFVILAAWSTLPDMTNPEIKEETYLLLSLTETWCCFLFQTLPRKTLQRYLPALTFYSPEVHLNVACPLLQPGTAATNLGELYHSDDALLRSYAQASLKKATEVRVQYRADSLRLRVNQGGEFCVFSNTGYGMVQIGYVKLSLPPNPLLLPSGNIWVQAEICEEGTIHPHHACQLACGTDPALRIAFNIAVVNEEGVTGTHWLTTTGKCAVFKCNSFVEDMEGLTREEIEAKERRIIRTRGRISYTSNPRESVFAE